MRMCLIFFFIFFYLNRYCRADKDGSWHEYRHAERIPSEINDYQGFKVTSKLDEITLRVEDCPRLLARLVSECLKNRNPSLPLYL